MAKLTAISFNEAVEVLNKAVTEAPKKIVSEILFVGLFDSTWREKYPEAYVELLKYRADLEESVRNVVYRSAPTWRSQ